MKQKTQNELGFTLAELLTASAISLMILTLSLQVILSNRGVYNTDTARTDVNQNLRASMDLVRDDIRQAGERFSASFPAVEIRDTSAGRELILRKNLTENVLPVCNDLVKNVATDILIDQISYTPALSSKKYIASDNSECPTESGSTAVWEKYRVDAGGVLRVYVYDSINKFGDFMDINAINQKKMGDYSGTTGLIKYPGYADSLRVSGNWPRSYTASKQPRVYLIEEHRYRLSGNTLQLIENDESDVDSIKNIATDIVSMNVDAYTDSGGTSTKMNGNGTVKSTDDWQSISFIRFTLAGKSVIGNRQSARTLTIDALPRNTFSK